MIQISRPGDSRLYVFRINLFAGVLSALPVAIDAYNGHVRGTSILPGMLLVLAGFQLAAIRARRAHVRPRSVRAWMRPVAYLLYGAGFLFIMLGINALTHLVAAS